ncbi:MAG: ABC transporter permease subunit, partial [Planctomycetales bacterium]|nr:ABC transporter permease subunit [Planctomycetales bacterium]NIP68746.1 ABC transporter permease subunit [Planctomycetales bacterium]
MNEEAQQLMDRGLANLSKVELRRWNRLLLESAYSGLIAVSPPTSLQLHYAGLDINGPLPISGDAFQKVIRQIVALCMYYVIGIAAVFVAILVTAPVIPHTIETGTIELLLSKPISRSLLFLSTFVGSCAFIFLNASYLISGLWLIAGIRFDIWEHKLLLCIPILLFRFAIYYSVSALAGLVWRSATVSVGLTMIFWAVCFCVEQSKVRIESGWIRPHRIVSILPGAEGILVISADQSVSQWNSDLQQWEQISETAKRKTFFGRLFGFSARRMLGPVYDGTGQMLLAAELPFRGGEGTSSGAFLQAAAAVNQWQWVAVAELPRGSRWLGSDPQGNVIAVAQQGVYRLNYDQLQVAERVPDDKFFVDLPKFELVYRPADRSTWTPRSATLALAAEHLAVWHGRH